MATIVEIGSLIDSSPGIRGGRPKIAGTGITVNRVVRCFQMGMNPEEVVSEYPHLTLAHVHAALTYYYANHEEIDADIQGEDEYAQLALDQHLSGHAG